MRLLLDDHMSSTVATALRERGYDAVATSEIDLHRLSNDERLWKEAIALGRVIATYDKDDFPLLFEKFWNEGVEHPGLILIFSGTIPQDDFGEQIRSLVVILERDPDLANQMLILRRAGA